MPNKFIRFFILESQFRFKFIILIIAVMIMALQFKTNQLQKKQLRQIKMEQALVMRIPEMERIIQANTVRTMAETRPKVQVTKVEFVLEGIRIQDGTSYALIDGIICEEGDVLGDYIVVKITRDSVILEDKSTQEVKELHFTN